MSIHDGMMITKLNARIADLEAERDRWREHCIAQAKLICALTEPPEPFTVSKDVVVTGYFADEFRRQLLEYQRRNPGGHSTYYLKSYYQSKNPVSGP